MSRSRRPLTALACAAGICALAAPAASAAPAAQPGASGGHGVVLSLARHAVRLVDRAHRVADVRVSSTRGLRRGDVVAVRRGAAHAGGHVGKVTVLARVVHGGSRGALVRLGDGSTLALAGGRPHGRRARSSSVAFADLTAGETLLVTLAADQRGNVVLALRVLSRPTDIGDGELHATGVVTDDSGDGTFGIATDDGSGLSFTDPQRLFEAADAEWCDEVEVGYHRAAGRLVADALRVTGQSEDGDCADDDVDAADELDGTVTALAADASSLTVAPDDDSAATTIAVDDPTLLDGIDVGDEVAVMLDENGHASDVELLDLSDDPGDFDDTGDDGDG